MCISLLFSAIIKNYHVKLPYRVKRFHQFIFSCLALAVLLPLGFSQQRFNHLEIDGQLYDQAGPFYFISYGNSSDAYAKADLLADVLGLEYSEEPALLRLTGADTELRFLLTRNVEAGLEKRVDALVVNGFARTSPSSIRVDGQVYVAINPIVEALSLKSEFDADERILWVDTASLNTSTPVPEPSTASTGPVALSRSPYLDPPRVGFQEDGSSRVVLDLPPGSRYNILVAEQQLLIQFLDANVAAFKRDVNDDNIASIRYALIDDKPGLIIDTKYALNANGAGFSRGALGASETNPNERLFIDFSPDLQGGEVSQANEPSITEITRASGTTLIPSDNQKIIVIDAGHGGHDPGAVSSYAKEEEVVLNVALGVRDLLEQSGIRVIMTRDDDFFLELEERASFANSEANLFVSIHANIFTNEIANGIETWVFGEPLEDSSLSLAVKENGGGSVGRALTEEAKAFANSIAGQIYRENQLIYSKGLADSVQSHLIAATGATDRGIKQDYFYVIRKARSPAILVELGFLSHPEEGAKLSTEAYQALLAESLASGILDFLDHGGLSASTRP